MLTGGHPLQFAGMSPVTVADVRRDPARFHEWDCVDPEESLNESAPYRGKCYKNESSVVIHTFKSGGGNYRLDKVEIKIDRDDPVTVFEQIESALSTGYLPDVFDWAAVWLTLDRTGL